MSTLNILLDTKDSISPNTPHDAVFNLNTLLKDDKYQYISLTGITFLNGRYNIHVGNNTLVFQEDGVAVDLTATLTPGNYTATELQAEIKTQMDAAGANTYTVTYDSITMKYTITTSGTSLKIMESSTCLFELGIEAGSLFTASVTSDNIVRLDGTEYVSVISTLHSENISSNGYTNILTRIPLQEPPGSLVYFQPSEKKPIKFTPGSFPSIDLRLFDANGRPYILPANCPVSYEFTLSLNIHH